MHGTTTLEIDERTTLDAVLKWGVEDQVEQAIEEMAELTVALQHAKRAREGAAENMVEEIADVFIMMAQLRQVVGPELVDEWIRAKMVRLRERIGPMSDSERLARAAASVGVKAEIERADGTKEEFCG